MIKKEIYGTGCGGLGILLVNTVFLNNDFFI